MMADPTVFVVDDDRPARESVCALVRSLGIGAEAFESAEKFLANYDPARGGCLVTDIRMIGMSGVELQERLAQDGVFLPVIVITAYPKTALTVDVMKKGAVTLLEKPYDEDDLWHAIRDALRINSTLRPQHARREEIRRRLAELTEKEREVMNRVVDGKANKVIAKELDVSVRTIENRRREVFAKMGAQSVAELVRMAVEVEDDKKAQTKG